MVPVTRTGWPERSVGENFAFLAACSAAPCSSAGPLTFFSEITLPVTSITTSTSTRPLRRARRASSGYMGIGIFRALPLRMPPDTGLSGPLRAGRGSAAGASPSTFTTGPAPTESVFGVRLAGATAAAGLSVEAMLSGRAAETLFSFFATAAGAGFVAAGALLGGAPAFAFIAAEFAPAFVAAGVEVAGVEVAGAEVAGAEVGAAGCDILATI